MSKRAQYLRLIGTLLAISLLLYLLSQQGWENIREAVRQIPLRNVILAFLLTLMSRLFIISRWHVLLRAVHIPVPVWQTMRLTFAGFFASNFLPTTIGGDVVRLAGAIQLKYDAATSAASLIIDRLVGASGMALALPFSLPSLLQYSQTTAGFEFPRVGFLLSTVKPTWIQKTRDRIIKFLNQLIKAVKLWINHPGALLAALVMTWGHMLCVFAIIKLLFSGMQTDIEFWRIAGLYSLVYFVTLLPVSINGYGLQEVSITVVFTNLAGASIYSSLVMALLLRTMIMIASLPGAFFIPGILAARERSSEPHPQDTI